MTFSNRFDFVETFATRAHQGQRYGEKHYLWHVSEVAQLTTDILSEKAERIIARSADSMALRTMLIEVAYLHDVIEDTPVTVEVLDHLFGYEVAAAVDLVTDPPGKNRKERKARLAGKVKLATSRIDPPEEKSTPRDWIVAAALIVKCADRLANVGEAFRTGSRLLTMYKKEHAQFRETFYSSLCDPGWKRIEAILSLSDPIDPSLSGVGTDMVLIEE